MKNRLVEVAELGGGLYQLNVYAGKDYRTGVLFCGRYDNREHLITDYYTAINTPQWENYNILQWDNNLLNDGTLFAENEDPEEAQIFPLDEMTAGELIAMIESTTEWNVDALERLCYLCDVDFSGDDPEALFENCVNKYRCE